MIRFSILDNRGYSLDTRQVILDESDGRENGYSSFPCEAFRRRAPELKTYR